MAAILLPILSMAAEIAEGPILLHADIDQQWGGHTFAYLLEGEAALFWSATAYNHGDGTWTQLVGSYPKPGYGHVPAATVIPVDGFPVHSMTQPLLLRSNDGYIHIFFGVAQDVGNPGYAPGEIRYYRSAAPEDIAQLVDRSDLVPRDPPYNRFHLRMNAGVSRDGQRAALVVLAISDDGTVAFNTPVIFQAEKQGLDYVFRSPVKYAEQMGLFYPQIALTDLGTVVVGQVWDDAEKSVARLIQLDSEGRQVHQVDLPAGAKGNYWCCDLRPMHGDTWETLGVYYNKIPADKEGCSHEFWTYVPETRKLEKHRSIPVPYSRANYGKWMPLSDEKAAFIHNPAMGRFDVWEGDLFGQEEMAPQPLPATDPAMHGLTGTAYTFVPNPLQGSKTPAGPRWFAVDYIPRDKIPENRGPCSFMLFRLNFPPGSGATP